MITGSDESLDQSDQGSDGVPGHHPQKPQPPQQPPQVPFLHLVSQSTLDSHTDVDDTIFMMMQSKVQNLLVFWDQSHTQVVGGRALFLSHLRSRTLPTQHFQWHANTKHLSGRPSSTFGCSTFVNFGASSLSVTFGVSSC